MDDVVWKTIDGFPNYEVSNKGGRIRNKKTGKELSKWVHNGRYYSCYRVNLYRNGKKTAPRVGRLVGMAFVYNDDPKNKTQIDHNDTNSFNDDSSNLEWVTHMENQLRRDANRNTKGKNTYLIEKLRKLNED